MGIRITDKEYNNFRDTVIKESISLDIIKNTRSEKEYQAALQKKAEDLIAGLMLDSFK